ncbi:tetratricopeptide repeat protein [Polyangium aurulentum]|nr:tetratricopeptide repeat protein [Polyangium aurulentum]
MHAQQPGAAAPAGPSQKDVAEATARFGKGNGLYKANKHKEALEEFRASYKAVASPNSHLYIARCLRETGQKAEAYLEFDAVVAEAQTAGEKYAATGEQAKTERDELASKIALVTVNVASPAPGATLTIGGKTVPEDRWGKPYPVAPGSVDVTLEAPGKPAAKESVTAKAGEQKTVSLSLPTGDTSGEVSSGDISGGDTGGDTSQASSGTSPLRLPAYIAAGVGVAGFVTFAVAGAMSKSTYSDLEQACGARPCPADRASDVSAGKTQQTVANVGLVVGAVGIAAGATLFVLSLRGGKKTEPAAAKTELVVGPSWLGARGTF